MKGIYQQFEDWVGQQDPAREYNYCDPYGCALAEFGKTLGYEHLVGLGGLCDGAVPLHIYEALNPFSLAPDKYTFGALADRLAKSRPGVPHVLTHPTEAAGAACRLNHSRRVAV